jgi:protein TonB
MLRWLVSFTLALMAVLASFIMILWMISPPKARVESKPVQVGHFVPMSRDSTQSRSRSRLKEPEPPPEQVQPPSPQRPQTPQAMQAPTVKLDLNLPSLPSSVSIQAAAMPSLAGVTAAKAAPAPAAPSAPAAAAPGPSGVDSEVIPLNEVLPEYPDQARRRGIEGHVKLAFIITAQGRVENIRVIESSPANVFDRSARRAAARWRFAPRTEGGRAVEREAVKTLEFRLTNGR